MVVMPVAFWVTASVTLFWPRSRDLLAWNDLDAGRCLQRRQIEAAAAAAWRGEIQADRRRCERPIAGDRAGHGERVEGDGPSLRRRRQRKILCLCWTDAGEAETSGER